MRGRRAEENLRKKDRKEFWGEKDRTEPEMPGAAENTAENAAEQEVLAAVLEAAQDVVVPESLLPERMEEKLRQLQGEQAAAQAAKVKQIEDQQDEVRHAVTACLRIDKKRKNRKIFYAAYTVCAAAVLAVCSYALFRTMEPGSGSALYSGQSGLILGQEERTDQSASGSSAAGGQSADGQLADGGQPASAREEEQSNTAGPVKEQKVDAGELYLVAADYQQVYDSITKLGYYYIQDGIHFAIPEATNSEIREIREAVTDGMASGAGAPTAAEPAAKYSHESAQISNSQDLQNKQEMSGAEDSQAAGKEFSTTNLQIEGVDESDIVKTDGSFLYLVRNHQIEIVDVRDGAPKAAGKIQIPFVNGSGDILELYVDGNLLIAVAQESETALVPVEETGANGSGEKKIDQEAVIALENGGTKQYRTMTKTRTTLYTYALKEDSQPVLLGSVSQDGYYHTSRKIDDKVYLFTDEWLGESCYHSSRDSVGWIPLAGEKQIAADCIYVPRSGGGNSLIISSVDVDNPREIYDTIMIVNDGATVYMSTDAIYLYNSKWDYNANNSYSGSKIRTEIAKFSLKDGAINATGAASVNGSVSDTFAVNAYQGMLRILTNDSRSEGSSLFILDEKLNLTGKIEGIAPGEQIYAARYLGDMAYFVTYRNMDPLFAADLSDPANPVILGELKITGYSDYLHMWKEGTMYGIGYETDPDTGAQKGVKLAMFDVSDPVNLSVLDTVILKDADYSPAMYQYKTVLSDHQNNLIGFAVTDYSKDERSTYLLFQWKDGAFENILTADIGRRADMVRGLYVGKYFYIVTMDEVIAFDRTDGFAEVGKLSLEN